LICPDLETCDVPITKYFFNHLCHKKGVHETCHHYCRRHDLLKPPMQWLQHLAVMAELKPPGKWMYELKLEETDC